MALNSRFPDALLVTSDGSRHPPTVAFPSWSSLLLDTQLGPTSTTASVNSWLLSRWHKTSGTFSQLSTWLQTTSVKWRYAIEKKQTSCSFSCVHLNWHVKDEWFMSARSCWIYYTLFIAPVWALHENWGKVLCTLMYITQWIPDKQDHFLNINFRIIYSRFCIWSYPTIQLWKWPHTCLFFIPTSPDDAFMWLLMHTNEVSASGEAYKFNIPVILRYQRQMTWTVWCTSQREKCQEGWRWELSGRSHTPFSASQPVFAMFEKQCKDNICIMFKLIHLNSSWI